MVWIFCESENSIVSWRKYAYFWSSIGQRIELEGPEHNGKYKFLSSLAFRKKIRYPGLSNVVDIFSVSYVVQNAVPCTSSRYAIYSILILFLQRLLEFRYPGLKLFFFGWAGTKKTFMIHKCRREIVKKFINCFLAGWIQNIFFP